MVQNGTKCGLGYLKKTIEQPNKTLRIGKLRRLVGPHELVEVVFFAAVRQLCQLDHDHMLFIGQRKHPQNSLILATCACMRHPRSSLLTRINRPCSSQFSSFELSFIGDSAMPLDGTHVRHSSETLKSRMTGSRSLPMVMVKQKISTTPRSTFNNEDHLRTISASRNVIIHC